MAQRPHPRPIIRQPKGSFRYIPLTQGQVAIVSAHRFEELNQFAWFAKWQQNTQSFYAYRKKLGKDGKLHLYGMHRHILGLDLGDPRKGDHVHGNTLDNRDHKLRVTDDSGNTKNARLRRDSTSGVKGVYRRSKRKWGAHIQADGKRSHLGYFFTRRQAIAARHAAAKERHREFACEVSR